jgi:DNA-directed RNA polymerase specialized sigma24 family protein
MKGEGGAAGAHAGGAPDNELVDLLKEQLEAGLGQEVFGVCCALAGTAQAQALLSRTMERVAGAIPHGLGGRALRPWLLGLAHREAAAGPALAPAPSPAPDSPEQARFEELSQPERSSLVMRETSGLPYGEIAEALGIQSSAQARDLVAQARLAMMASVPGPTPECKVVREAVTRGGLPPLGQRAVDRHLERCPYCRKVQVDVAALPGVLRKMLPKIAPTLAVFLLKEALAHAAMGQAEEPEAPDEEKASRDAYRRRRSRAAAGVLALLVIVSAMAVLTGRLTPDSTNSGASALLLPSAFIDLGDLIDDDPKPPDCVGPNCEDDSDPEDCLAGSEKCPDLCPDGVRIRPDCDSPKCPPGTSERDCPPPIELCPPDCPPVIRLCPPDCDPPKPIVPCPDGTIAPDCTKPPPRCPDGTVEPDCEKPPRCPDGTIEPDCEKPPPRCPDGTVEPDCTPPPPRCPDGTVEPDCTPPTRCPDGTVEPNCTPPFRCPVGTVEPDCHKPPVPCPAGTIEPDCHPPPGPVCPPGTHPHDHHGCVPDLEPMPDLCDRHYGHGHRHHHGDRQDDAPESEPEPEVVQPEPPLTGAPPVDAPAPAANPVEAAEPAPAEQPDPAAAEEPALPEETPPAEEPAPAPAEDPAPPTSTPVAEEPVPAPAPVPAPVEDEPDHDDDDDQEPDRGPGEMHAQWAVTPQRRTSRRRWTDS